MTKDSVVNLEDRTTNKHVEKSVYVRNDMHYYTLCLHVSNWLRTWDWQRAYASAGYDAASSFFGIAWEHGKRTLGLWFGVQECRLSEQGLGVRVLHLKPDGHFLGG